MSLFFITPYWIWLIKRILKFRRQFSGVVKSTGLMRSASLGLPGKIDGVASSASPFSREGFQLS
jgi:hypothetical protein